MEGFACLERCALVGSRLRVEGFSAHRMVFVVGRTVVICVIMNRAKI